MQPPDPSIQVAYTIKQVLENKTQMIEKQKKEIQYEVWEANELNMKRISSLLSESEQLLKALQQFRQHFFLQIQQHQKETCLIPSQFLDAWSALMKELEECKLPPMLEHLERRQLSQRQLDDFLQNLDSCVAFVQRWKHVIEKAQKQV